MTKIIRGLIGAPFILLGAVVLLLGILLLEIAFVIARGHPEGSIELRSALIRSLGRA